MGANNANSSGVKLERIARLKRRLAMVAEADAKECISDPVVAVLKGILDLLADEL